MRSNHFCRREQHINDLYIIETCVVVIASLLYVRVFPVTIETVNMHHDKTCDSSNYFGFFLVRLRELEIAFFSFNDAVNTNTAKQSLLFCDLRTL